eukprot:TRINITY_DN6717_c0_g1_i1.p1 TRINITY_DN6717_c0_g1~~TRINITY_DN6717_c0_g1_i1.p1  ORF type:complete len:410 (-),score=77.35 TRINITY_DN6717_c0_g1_i1:12-1241(-)
MEEREVSEYVLAKKPAGKSLQCAIFDCIENNLDSFHPHSLHTLPSQIYNKLIEHGIDYSNDPLAFLSKLVCPQVTHLDMRALSLTNTFLHQIATQCPKLQVLIFDGYECDYNVEILREILKNCTDLETFGIESWECPSVSGLFSPEMKKLKHLNLGSNKLEPSELSSAIISLGSITTLDLGFSEFNDEGVKRILKSCNLLEALNISNCPLITDLSLKYVGKYRPTIKSLNISWNENITALHYLTKLQDLEYLGLTGISKDTNAEHFGIILQNNKNLHTLFLAHTRLLNESNLSKLPNLKCLNKLVCADITFTESPQSFTHFYNCASLRVLDVGDNSSSVYVSSWIVGLCERVPLTDLDISGNKVSTNKILSIAMLLADHIHKFHFSTHHPIIFNMLHDKFPHLNLNQIN